MSFLVKSAARSAADITIPVLDNVIVSFQTCVQEVHVSNFRNFHGYPD
jgi:hypothetical protein